MCLCVTYKLTNHWSGHLIGELSLTLKPHVQTLCCVTQCKSLNNWQLQGYVLFAVYLLCKAISFALKLQKNMKINVHTIFSNTTECKFLCLCVCFMICVALFGCCGFQGVFETDYGLKKCCEFIGLYYDS